MFKYGWICCLLLAACNNNPRITEKEIVAAASNVVTAPAFECHYDLQKTRCKELFLDYKKESSPVNEKRLINYISDSLLTCWYGTRWDFNGTTEQPGTGSIACGYFVTTVLRDAGYPINRVRLAQCASRQLVNATCGNIVSYRDKTLDHFVGEVMQKGYGLYIVGLDYHTGFILNDGKEVYFIHSGVYQPTCALKEKAIESRTLLHSRYRVLGRIKF